MLREALNALTRIHSRPGWIMRSGAVSTPDIYSPCRLTPSNFFRFGNGPEYSVIRGQEFIIPVDSLYGNPSQRLLFGSIPDAGTIQITVAGVTTSSLPFNTTAADIQTNLRIDPSLSNVLVRGDFSAGFTFEFPGLQIHPLIGSTAHSLTHSGVAVSTSWQFTSTAWDVPLQRNDRILDGVRRWSIDDIIELNDLGASIMAYRCRVD